MAYITKNQFKQLMQQHPEEAPENLVNELIDQGHQLEGLNDEQQSGPITAKNIGTGFVKGAGRTVVDTVSMAKSAADTVINNNPVTQFVESKFPIIKETNIKIGEMEKKALDKASQALKPKNTGEKIGGYVETAAEIITPAGAATRTKAGQKIIKEALAETAAKKGKKIDKVVNKIVQQGKPQAVEAAKKALLSVKTKGVKTYADLSKALDNAAKEGLKKVDSILAEHPNQYSIKDLGLKKVAGESEVVVNSVKDAINHLKEAYSKTLDKVELAKIKQLEQKAKTSGLTLSEVNNLARKYGTEFKQKAFGKTGEALTSISAKAYENTRTGLKDTVRTLHKIAKPNDNTLERLDKATSKVLGTKEMANKIVEKVNSLEAKFKDENAIMKTGKAVGKTVAKVLDTMLAGSLRGATSYLAPSNIGNKIMNYKDIENALAKNLKKLDALHNSKSLREKFLNSLLKK